MNYNFIRQITRQIRRHPLFYSLNLLGLGIGIACAFVLLSYVRQEWSYDRSIPYGDRIYRIGTNFMDMGGFAISQEKLQPVLEERCRAVEHATRFRGGSDLTFEIDQRTYTIERGLYVDTNFFQVFAYQFIEGQADHSLQTADQIVLTEDIARRFFGSPPYLGKTLHLAGEDRTLSVAGVVSPFPGNTHLPATVWLSVTPQLSDDRSWTSARYYTYVKTHQQSSRSDLEDFFSQLQREEIHPQSAPDSPFESWISSSQAVHFYVQPLREIYLYSDLNMDITAGGNPTQVWVLGLIGLFILIMAGVNYINLSTATAAGRAKEIGIKKTMGANRSQLIIQFLGESLTLSLLAMIIAGSLSGLLLRVLESVSGEVLMTSILDGLPQWLLLLAFSVGTGLLAGAYPAFYLSRFRPVWALKNDASGYRKGRLRNMLVVFQFSIAAALMISSLVIFRQLSYMQHSDKGFQHENVLVIRNFDDLDTKKETLRELIEQHSQVVTTSINSRMPAGYNIWRATYQSEGMDQSISLNGFPIDENYLPTMGIKLLEGRNFSGDLATDTSNVILNESAVKALELKEPIGAVLNDNRRVIGVVSDFNFESFRNQIAPIVFNYDVDGYQLAIKFGGTDLPAFTRYLEESWNKLAGDQEIRSYFLDDNLAELSAKEAILSRAIGIFTILALFIACLGLFGLTTHATVRRAKEIGVRKVLGATVQQIVVLLSRDFLSLVAVAFIIGIPVAWMLVSQWLQGFVYRITLEWWMFAGPALVGIGIAFLTLSYQSISAALNDPAKVLKDE